MPSGRSSCVIGGYIFLIPELDSTNPCLISLKNVINIILTNDTHKVEYVCIM